MRKMIMTMGLVLTAAAAFSQNYWVVENEKRNVSIVKIYDSNNQLVSESRIEKRIDINKRKVRRMLYKLAGQNDALLWSKR